MKKEPSMIKLAKRLDRLHRKGVERISLSRALDSLDKNASSKVSDYKHIIQLMESWELVSLKVSNPGHALEISKDYTDKLQSLLNSLEV